MSAPQGWHPDPTRRHQARWWDGTQWTEWVADDGRTSQDPIGPPPPPQGTMADAASPTGAGVAGDSGVDHLLSRPRLYVEIGGGTFASPGWRAILDGDQQPVGRIQREGRIARVFDLRGTPVFEASARLVGRGTISDKSVGDLRVSAGGRLLATASFVQAKAVTFRFHPEGRDREQALVARFERSFRGVVEGGVITLPDGRAVGSVVEWGRETSGMVLRSWIVLDKDPNLPEPYRSLAVAAPLLFDVYNNPVGRET